MASPASWLRCLGHDPFDRSIYVFRSKRADRLKLIVWDGSGAVLLAKRLDGTKFVWPKRGQQKITLTRVQFEALLGGIDWQKIAAPSVKRPAFV